MGLTIYYLFYSHDGCGRFFDKMSKMSHNMRHFLFVIFCDLAFFLYLCARFRDFAINSARNSSFDLFPDQRGL